MTQVQTIQRTPEQLLQGIRKAISVKKQWLPYADGGAYGQELQSIRELEREAARIEAQITQQQEGGR